MSALNPADPLPQLAPIGQPVADNAGGVQEILVLPQAALLRQPLRRGGSIVGDLVLAPGAAWVPIRATLDTASFDQAFSEDRQQGLYSGSLTGEVAEDTPELAAALLGYRNVKLLLLYRDRNERLKLAGDTTSWYKLSYKQTTQTGAGGRAGYALELAGRSLQPALFYGGQLPTTAGSVPTLPGAGAGGTGTVQLFNARGKLMGTAQAGQRVIISGPFRTTITIQ